MCMCFLLVGKSHQIPPRVPAPTCVYNPASWSDLDSWSDPDSWSGASGWVPVSCGTSGCGPVSCGGLVPLAGTQSPVEVLIKNEVAKQIKLNSGIRKQN